MQSVIKSAKNVKPQKIEHRYCIFCQNQLE